MKKYDFTGEKKTLLNGKTVSRIRAVRDIPRFAVKSGELGGWLEFSENLVETDDCWVSEEAIVTGHATVVKENAFVGGEAVVSALFDGYTIIASNCFISGNAQLEDCVLTGADITVRGEVKLTSTNIYGSNIIIQGSAIVSIVTIMESANKVRISDNAIVRGGEEVLRIKGVDITISGNAHLQDIKNINGVNFTALEDCFVGEGVALLGDNISLAGASSLRGRLNVGNRIHLFECASIFNDTDKWVTVSAMDLDGDISLCAASL